MAIRCQIASRMANGMSRVKVTEVSHDRRMPWPSTFPRQGRRSSRWDCLMASQASARLLGICRWAICRSSLSSRRVAMSERDSSKSISADSGRERQMLATVICTSNNLKCQVPRPSVSPDCRVLGRESRVLRKSRPLVILGRGGSGSWGLGSGMRNGASLRDCKCPRLSRQLTEISCMFWEKQGTARARRGDEEVM